MPRKPRFFLPNVPLHIVQRGHNRQAVFFEDEDRETYLEILRDAIERNECDVHAYVLMTNHIHLLVSARTSAAISRMMQFVGLKYVPYINRTYGNSGTLWEGRFRASLIEPDEYLLACMRYIELNPVRANIVRSPGSFKWSSYRANAQGRDDPLVTFHPVYNALASGAAARRAAYRELFRERLTSEQVNDITAAWQTGTPLGGKKFLDKVERKLKQPVGYARRGRPPKPAAE